MVINAKIAKFKLLVEKDPEKEIMNDGRRKTKMMTICIICPLQSRFKDFLGGNDLHL